MTATPTVRRCRARDWPEVRHLHVQMALGIPLAIDVELNDIFATPDRDWQDFTTACASGADQALFVAEIDGECVGMGHVSREQSRARLATLFVTDRARRHGVGSAILNAQEHWARALGAHELVCHIPDTSAAVHLVRRTGWARTEDVFTTTNRLVERRWVNVAR